MAGIEEQKLRQWISEAGLRGGWQINEVIGHGRRSVVYDISRTTDAGEEHSALKAICEYPTEQELEQYASIGMTSEGIESLFASKAEADKREIHAMQRLQGEAYLVTYYDFDIVKPGDLPGEIILIRMEKLTPLKMYLRFTPLTEKRVITIALCIAYALETCHTLQPILVHGDVKPDNIYHFKGDVYKLGDFGISKTEEAAGSTLTAGTPEYMPPEVEQGRSTPLSDIYSLGKSILYLLGVSDLTCTEKPPTCQNGALWALVQQMTMEDPFKRPGSISSVIASLEKLQGDETNSWYLNLLNQEGETLTDVLEQRTARPEELFNADEKLTEDSNSTEVDDDEPKAGVSDTLDEAFKEELLRRKRKKKILLLSILCTALLAVLVTLIVLFAGAKESKTGVEAKLSATLNSDGILIIQWENAGKDSCIAIYSAHPQKWGKSQSVPEGTVDFVALSDGSLLILNTDVQGKVNVGGLAPGTVYHVSLLSGSEILAHSQIQTQDAEVSNEIQVITHLLYSFSKSKFDENTSTHEQLASNWLLKKMNSNTMLYAQAEYLKQNGIYLHLTCKNDIQDVRLLVTLRIEDETYAVYANQENGTAGSFGGNKLYVLLDELLEAVHIVEKKDCELRLYAQDGCMYSFVGAISP